MMLHAVECLGGGVVVTLPRKPGRHIRAGRRKGGAPRGRVRTYTPKAQSRFRRALATTAYDWGSSVAATLAFPQGATPAHAKAQMRRLVRVLRRLVPGCFGHWSLEFKRDGRPHLHLIVCALRRGRDLLAARRQLRATFGGMLAYWRAVYSLGGWTRYLGKADDQRKAPAEFAAATGNYWGAFGRPPKRATESVAVPEAARHGLRGAVGHLVRKQGRRRSHAVACAVEASTGRVAVYLSRPDWQLLRADLEKLEKQSPARPARPTPPAAASSARPRQPIAPTRHCLRPPIQGRLRMIVFLEKDSSISLRHSNLQTIVPRRPITRAASG